MAAMLSSLPFLQFLQMLVPFWYLNKNCAPSFLSLPAASWNLVCSLGSLFSSLCLWLGAARLKTMRCKGRCSAMLESSFGPVHAETSYFVTYRSGKPGRRRSKRGGAGGGCFPVLDVIGILDWVYL